MPSVWCTFDSTGRFSCGMGSLCAHLYLRAATTGTFFSIVFLSARLELELRCVLAATQPDNRKLTETHTHARKVWIHIRNNKRTIMIWYLVRATNDEIETFSDPLPICLPSLMPHALSCSFTLCICDEAHTHTLRMDEFFSCGCGCDLVRDVFTRPKHQWIKSDLLLTEMNRRKYVWKP